MRHFEKFEIEHLLNSTGSWLLRLQCRRHLKQCEICRQRQRRILEENLLGERIRHAVKRFEGFDSLKEKNR